MLSLIISLLGRVVLLLPEGTERTAILQELEQLVEQNNQFAKSLGITTKSKNHEKTT